MSSATTASSPLDRPRLNAIAVPIVGEFLLGMSVAMAGLWLASHTSDVAAGTFGLANQVLESLFVMFRVLAIGVGIIITQYLGGQQKDAARRTALVGLGASTWVGMVAGACLLFGHDLILDTLNAPPEVRPIAEIYLQLLAPVMLVEAYNQTMAAILRAHLHVRDSLGVMILMHTSHLILAFVFMHGLGEWEGWGLNGYAAALFISRSLGLGLHLWLWRKRMHLKPQRDDWWNLPVGALTPVLRIGLPGAALELVYRMAFMVSVAATAKLGVQALATHSYTLQLLKFVLLISLSIGWACEIMVGRLIGSGRLREAHELVQKGLRNGLLASGLMALLAAIFAPWLMKAFTRDPAIIAAAQTLLWLSLALETGRVFNLVVIGALRATGDVNFPVLASMGSLILVLGVGSYFMGQAYGLPGIWVVYAAEEWIRGLVMQTRWQLGGWIKHARNTQRGLRILG